MNRFPEVQQALSELRADRNIMFGIHEGPQLKVGVPGRIVSEVPFDPELHDPLAINPLSIWEDILDEPHVQQVIPERPLAMNVVVHHGEAGENMPEWLAPLQTAKQQLAEELSQALAASRLPGDQVKTYIMGASETSEPKSGRGLEIINGMESPEASSRAVAEICRRGLTFVISDFNRLRLERGSLAEPAGVVAIKANHALERKLPANVGVLALGGLKEANTNNRRELETSNAELRTKHAEIVARLGQAGVAVASVIFDSRQAIGFDSQTADREIAKAVRTTHEGKR